ncbi:MAG: hypothetical protein AB7O59_04605 [Pirellulales bacterium]
MRTVFRSATAVAIVGIMAVSLAYAADDAKPKYTIKDVMKKAHKDGLMKKLAGGQGTKEDAEQLLDLYKSLGRSKPPKGDVESWKTKTTVLVEVAQEVVDGKEGSRKMLEKAANCAECHKAHKGA